MQNAKALFFSTYRNSKLPFHLRPLPLVPLRGSQPTPNPLTGVGFLQTGEGETRWTRGESRQGRKTELKEYG